MASTADNVSAAHGSPVGQRRRRSPWPHRLAVLTAGATLLLIFVGGLVTNTGSALAVPDWPTTFGHNMFLYPWSQMVGGIFYEHSHRLLGSGVGMLSVALAVSLWLSEEETGARVLGLIAVAAVLVQGVLGGLRVVLLDHRLAVIHGCVAQAFFALVVSLAVVTAERWRTPLPATRLTGAARLRALALISPPLVYTQAVLGALLTHTGNWLTEHLLFAGLATVAIGMLVAEVLRVVERSDVRRMALLLATLLAGQLGLGLGAYLWRFRLLSASLPPTAGLALLAAHRVTGAAVWGTSVALTLRVLRLVGAAQTAVRPAAVEERRSSASLSGSRNRRVLA